VSDDVWEMFTESCMDIGAIEAFESLWGSSQADKYSSDKITDKGIEESEELSLEIFAVRSINIEELEWLNKIMYAH
jgi:hypothetical protein